MIAGVDAAQRCWVPLVSVIGLGFAIGIGLGR